MKILPKQEQRNYLIQYGSRAGWYLRVQRRVVPKREYLTISWGVKYGNDVTLRHMIDGPSMIKYIRATKFNQPNQYYRKEIHFRYGKIKHSADQLLKQYGINTIGHHPWFVSPMDEMIWYQIISR